MEVKDIFGIAPYGESVKISIEKTFDGIGSFLNIVFKPGLEELALMMRDQVRIWRLNNALKVMEKSKNMLNFDGSTFQLQANARVGFAILDECSKVDDDNLQDLWAGLFASSCTKKGADDSNLIFVDILSHLSSVEAKILEYGCRNAPKILYPNQLIVSGEFKVSMDTLIQITGITDVYRLDQELDHLNSLNLLDGSNMSSGGGFVVGDNLDCSISPSSLALNLYYKTHALTDQTVKEFWNDQLILSSEKG